MKIAIVCFNLKWQAGGTRLIYELAINLKKIGNDVVIYAPEVNEQAFPELRAGLDIRVIPPPGVFSWNKKIPSLFGKIKDKIAQERVHTETGKIIAAAMDMDFDVVNLHDFAYKVAPFYKKRNKKAKIVWTENDPPYMYLPKDNWLYDRLSWIFNSIKDIREKAFYRAIDSVVVLDGYNKKWCEERNLDAKVVRSGVDFDNFYAPARVHTNNKNNFTLFSLGALNKYRRFEDIIDAAKILHKRGQKVKVNIIAKDIWNEAEYKDLLIKKIGNSEIEEYISINFEGASNQELKNAFESADAFVLTTHLPLPRNGYGWGLTNFEAMASGLPLVIYNTSTATEVLTHRENAVIVESRNSTDLADQIQFLIENPERYNRITAAGQQFVKENISWKKYAEDLVKIL
jgi:glycosyltransferase involved in cell wall biosynthesis